MQDVSIMFSWRKAFDFRSRAQTSNFALALRSFQEIVARENLLTFMTYFLFRERCFRYFDSQIRNAVSTDSIVWSIVFIRLLMQGNGRLREESRSYEDLNEN